MSGRKSKTVNLSTLLRKFEEKAVAEFGCDFLQTWDKSTEALEATVLAAQILRELSQGNTSLRVFHKGLAISWFRDKSTRTRYSFAAAGNLLGLGVTDLDEEHSQITHGETVRETATMLAFLTEVFGIRDDIFLGEGHRFMEQVAQALDEGVAEGVLVRRPSVLNLQSDRDHPTQSLSDLLHLVNVFGDVDQLQGKKMVMSWAYSPSYGKPLSVAQGFVDLMTRFGVKVVLAYPEGYGLIPEIERMSGRAARSSGGSFEVIHDMKEAFREADVVYPKSWAPYRIMEERTRLLSRGDKEGLVKLEREALAENAKHTDWECSELLMKLTKGGKGLYMHCLPADVTGVSCEKGEVAQPVFERYRRAVFMQASFKPFIIAAMIILTRFEKPARLLRSLVRTR